MFKKLKDHWHVNNLNLVLIIATFAFGGSLCGYTGRRILLLTDLEKGPVWIILYIILITLLWPICVLLISIPLGKFAFFKKYIIKVWRKISGKTGHTTGKTGLVRIAIFASGAGSNAEKIIKTSPPSPLLKERGGAETEANHRVYEVVLIVCNKPGVGVLQIAEKAGIPSLLIEKERFFNGDHYLPELKSHQVDFIVLAGFLWKMPVTLISTYPKKIINIHPALLPKYGGRGMYGNRVHEAVIAACEKESGITIHYVDEQYDHGEIIFQAKCMVTEYDTVETLAQKIHVLEHTHYPKVTGDVVKKQNRS